MYIYIDLIIIFYGKLFFLSIKFYGECKDVFRCIVFFLFDFYFLGYLGYLFGCYCFLFLLSILTLFIIILYVKYN